MFGTVFVDNAQVGFIKSNDLIMLNLRSGAHEFKYILTRKTAAAIAHDILINIGEGLGDPA